MIGSQGGPPLIMENGQTAAPTPKLGLPPLTPNQQEALQKVNLLQRVRTSSRTCGSGR